MNENMNAYLEDTAENTAKKIAENCFDPCGLYFSVWCYETGYTQSQSFIVDHLKNNSVSGADNMQDAARFFVRTYDKIGGDMFFAKNWNKIKNMIVWVQDWRGRIAKFEIKVESQPIYYARRIN